MAEQKLLQVTISRVDGPVFDGEALALSVPGKAGAMQLLANHEPLISPLVRGTVTVTLASGDKEFFSIESGTLEISRNHATVLI